MTDEKIIITPEQAIELVKIDGEATVHCFIQKGPMFIGADHDIESVTETFNDAEHIEIGGEQCEKMGHAVVVFPKDAKMHSGLRFFAHDKEELKKFLEKNEQ